MKTKHTPPPWRLELRGDAWVVIGAGELPICTFAPMVPELAEEQIANMNLIAGAAWMLAALRAIRKATGPQPAGTGGGAWPYELSLAANHAAHGFADAAIRRAEGVA